MVFSSPIFLFGFFPLFLIAYALVGAGLRNALLLFASLVFYAWGEPVFVGLLIFSILWNYGFGQALRRQTGSNPIFWTAIAVNLLALGVFKYGAFILLNVTPVLVAAGVSAQTLTDVIEQFPALPIGISFYTFQAISYLTDVKRGQCPPQANVVDFGMYLAMFPQLIAGPIVRYTEVYPQLKQRPLDWIGLNEGVTRFVRGLARKVLIADPLAVAVDAIFAAPIEGLSTPLAWLAVAGYTLQIYHDFAGYSDMAIGIGRMLGFNFPENFDQPYRARSMREFWRRWHLTLSRWFRDYLYIPLGGNRATPARVTFNLILVFALCGLWHGASWNFVVWGLFHGAFLGAERLGFSRLLERIPRLGQHTYVLLVVMFSWVIFRADSLTSAIAMMGRMLGASTPTAVPLNVIMVCGWGTALAFVCGALVALVRPFRLRSGPTIRVGREVLTVLLLVTCLIAIASGAYSPFLYFRF